MTNVQQKASQPSQDRSSQPNQANRPENNPNKTPRSGGMQDELKAGDRRDEGDRPRANKQ